MTKVISTGSGPTDYMIQEDARPYWPSLRRAAGILWDKMWLAWRAASHEFRKSQGKSLPYHAKVPLPDPILDEMDVHQNDWDPIELPEGTPSLLVYKDQAGRYFTESMITSGPTRCECSCGHIWPAPQEEGVPACPKCQGREVKHIPGVPPKFTPSGRMVFAMEISDFAAQRWMQQIDVIRMERDMTENEKVLYEMCMKVRNGEFADEVADDDQKV